MNDMLGQNVEISNDIDSMGKVESSSRKLKFHDITYEKVNGAFKKRLAERNIKKEIKEEVNDYSVDNDQEHLDNVAVLMSQYKFINTGVKESAEFIARRAIRLNEQMIFNAKLNSKLIDAMLEKEKVDNVSTIDESDEEKLVNAINQINQNEEVKVEEETSLDDPTVPIDINNTVEVDQSVPVAEGFSSESVEVEQPVEDKSVDINNNDFAPLFNEMDNNAGTNEVEENNNSILPMTDEEIEASREKMLRTEPREDTHRFSFEDIFGPENVTETKEEEKEFVPERAINDEEAFLEVDKLLQEADDLKSRGNKANEERERAEQRRKAAEDRRRQANDDEAMKKAALADAIEKYKAYVAELKATENETLKDIESANAAADEYEQDTKAAEERSAYTQKVIESLMNSMENRPKRR